MWCSVIRTKNAPTRSYFGQQMWFLVCAFGRIFKISKHPQWDAKHLRQRGRCDSCIKWGKEMIWLIFTSIQSTVYRKHRIKHVRYDTGCKVKDWTKRLILESPRREKLNKTDRVQLRRREGTDVASTNLYTVHGTNSSHKDQGWPKTAG